MPNFSELVFHPTVQPALERVINQGDMAAARFFWHHNMSPESRRTFQSLYIRFEACVRQRYYMMTGETLPLGESTNA